MKIENTSTSLSDAAIALLVSTARTVAEEHARARGLELGGLMNALVHPTMAGTVTFEVSYHPRVHTLPVHFQPTLAGSHLRFRAPFSIGHTELAMAELFAV